MEKGGIDVYIISYSKRLYFVVCIFTIKRAKEKRRSKMVGQVILNVIIVSLLVLLLIYVLRTKRNFDSCYYDMENDGIACCGIRDFNSCYDYMEDNEIACCGSCCGILDVSNNPAAMCTKCPYYTPIDGGTSA